MSAAIASPASSQRAAGTDGGGTAGGDAGPEPDSQSHATAPSSPAPPAEDEPRQCWICLDTEEEDAEPAGPASPGSPNPAADPVEARPRTRPAGAGQKEEWVRPCKCRGSTVTCHQKCIRTWVQRKREQDPTRPVLCPSCQTPYSIKARPRPLLIRFAHSLADIYALTPAILFVVMITYGFYLLAAEYGRLALSVLMGPDAAVLVEGHAAWQPSYGPGVYHRTFTLSLLAMLFQPLDVVFLFLAARMFGGMPGGHAAIAALLVAADVPSYIYRLIVIRLVVWIRRKFGWAAMARLQTFPPVAALAAAGVLWAVPAAAADDPAAHDDEEGAQGRNDQVEAAGEQQLRRLARAVSFPNATVVTSQRAISSSSFVLKIFVLEDRQNARNGEQVNAGEQMVPRALYVEYERANILLAVIRSRFFRAQNGPVGVAPRNLRPAAVAPDRRVARAAREQQRMQRRADRMLRANQAAQAAQTSQAAAQRPLDIPLPPTSPGPVDPPYIGRAFGSPIPIPFQPTPPTTDELIRNMSSPLAADSAADTALETGTENQRGRAMRGPVDGGDTAMPELLAPRPSKGKERLDLVAGMEPGAAPNVVEIPAGPPLVRVGTERTAGAFATPPFSPAPPLETSESVEPSATENENETPFAFHSPPYRPHSPPTVSTVRRRKERSREPGHVRRHSGHRGQMMSDAVRPLAGVEGRESPGPAAERARSPAPEQRPHANAGGVPPAAAAAGAARPQQQQQGANAQVPGPREAFLAIDVRTVRTHVYHLVAHTLLLPFVVALIAEYIVFPITALIYSYVVLVSPGHYLVIDFLRWLGRELLRSRASRSVMAGVCYGIGREVSVRWWRGRMKQERGDFTVEDWKPESEQAANASNANANAV